MPTIKIRITLTDATAGTWTAADGSVVATGVKIPKDHDFWAVADGLTPGVTAWLGDVAGKDLMVQAIDPNGVGLDGPEPDQIVCEFRVLDGDISAQV